MSGKKYKKLRHEAEKHGIPYKVAKWAFKKLSHADRIKLLADTGTI